MAVLRIGSKSWDGVSERVAGNPHDSDVFEGLIDCWVCMFGRTAQQLLALTETHLVLVADGGDYPVPLTDVVSWEGGLLRTRSYGETRITIPGGSRQDVERALASRAPPSVSRSCQRSSRTSPWMEPGVLHNGDAHGTDV